jgi:hypothetical protein
MHVNRTTDRRPPNPGPEQCLMSIQSRARPTHCLSRMQQLTLTTWRLADTKLQRVLNPFSVLEQAALHAALATLRDVDDPVALFGRHAAAHAELALITSLVPATQGADLSYDILDSAFLLRWNELVADGTGPQELPPLRPRWTHSNQQRES